MRRAYDGVARIEFDGMQYRRDIGREGAAARRPARDDAMTIDVLILMGSDSDAPIMTGGRRRPDRVRV